MSTIFDTPLPAGRGMGTWGTRPTATSVPASSDGSPAAEHPTFIARPPRVTADRLVLSPAVHSTLELALARVKHHELLDEEWGMREVDPNAGCPAVLLHGPAGTGKSSLAEAMAAAVGRCLIDLDLAAVESAYPGQAAKNLRAAFAAARSADAVLFIDECSALIGRRPTGGQAADRNHHLTQSVLLKLLEAHTGLVVFATNYLAELEPAFGRRILVKVEVPLPDRSGRAALWARLVPPRAPGRDGLDYAALADSSENLAGGDIKNAVWLALAEAVRRPPSGRVLRQDDLLQAAATVQADKARFGQDGQTQEG